MISRSSRTTPARTADRPTEPPPSTSSEEPCGQFNEFSTAPAPVGPGDRWTLPDLSGVTAVVQPHCHHHAVMGFGPDQALLARAGATFSTLAGCCGLAGSFGMEAGHDDVSVAVAEHALLPALRAAAPGDVYLADGYSCRTQAEQLAGVRGVHLAQLLAAHLPS